MGRKSSTRLKEPITQSSGSQSRASASEVPKAASYAKPLQSSTTTHPQLHRHEDSSAEKKLSEDQEHTAEENDEIVKDFDPDKPHYGLGDYASDVEETALSTGAAKSMHKKAGWLS